MTSAPTTSVQRAGAILQQTGVSLVLREAFFGVRRFDDFQRNLGISRSVLAKTLKTLVEQGLLERRRYQQRPDRHEYRLTEAGIALYPVFLAMKEWGDRWLGEDVTEIILHHKACGRDFRPVMVCDGCGTHVQAREVSYRFQSTPSAQRGDDLE